jgi:Transport and Golgi organisation 2
MCTVTYLPKNGGFYLTSNRDEKHTRSKALLPQIYYSKGNSFIFPKDADAGGTWIVLKENKDALCLLNGAFENFIDKGNYTKSRGRVVLDIADTQDMIVHFHLINLEKTAPFTLILIQSYNVYECRWDGDKKHVKLLENSVPHIWSSATLYDAALQHKRSEWFKKWLLKNKFPSQDDMIAFHKNTGDGDVENNLIMNRDNKIFTVSITSITSSPLHSNMKYHDIINNDSTTTKFEYEHQLN